MPWAIGPWASQSMLPCRRKMSPNQRQLISAADSNPHGTNQNASVRLAVLADSLYNLGGIGGGPRATDLRLFRTRLAALPMMVILTGLTPVQAQSGGDAPVQMLPPTELNLSYFQQQLAPFGAWINHAKFRQVWRPDPGSGFRPYFNGYW